MEGTQARRLRLAWGLICWAAITMAQTDCIEGTCREADSRLAMLGTAGGVLEGELAQACSYAYTLAVQLRRCGLESCAGRKWLQNASTLYAKTIALLKEINWWPK